MQVTIQCDASKDGVGGTLLQPSTTHNKYNPQQVQPVVYVSRALTTTEQKYAQIEKELLEIVLSNEKKGYSQKN